MLTKIREMIKNERFKLIIDKYDIDTKKVCKNYDDIEVYILTGRKPKHFKTHKIPMLIDIVNEKYDCEFPYEAVHGLSIECGLQNYESVLHTSNSIKSAEKTREGEYFEFEQLYLMVINKFKYPNGFISRSLHRMRNHNGYKTHEDYAHDFVLYAITRKLEFLYTDFGSLDSRHKYVSRCIANYIKELLRTISRKGEIHENY